jgi:hypothetical protein
MYIANLGQQVGAGRRDHTERPGGYADTAK